MNLSLKVLDTPTMISTSASWLAPSGLAAIPEASGLVARVRSMHDALVEARPAAAPETSAELAAIIVAEQKADNGHDYALRAWLALAEANRCWALSEDPPDEERAAAFTSLVALLVPGGPKTTQRTYIAESGGAAQASQRLDGDAASQKLVAAMRLTTKITGRDVFDRYVEKGAELGNLEGQKKAAEASAGQAAVPATLLKARNGWIRVAAAVAAVLEQAEGSAAASLLAALSAESDKARQKAARAKKGGASPPAAAAPPAGETTPAGGTA